MTNTTTTLRPHVAAFLATSLDGYIARLDGSLDWLIERGRAAGDTGYEAFMAEIDSIVLGRATYELASRFDQWPYGTRPVAVLSTRLDASADPRVTVHRNLPDLLAHLGSVGAGRVYADGGRTVTALLAASALDELTVTTIPVLLGSGIPLYGPLPTEVPLTHRYTNILGAGLVQSRYTVDRFRPDGPPPPAPGASLGSADG